MKSISPTAKEIFFLVMFSLLFWTVIIFCAVEGYEGQQRRLEEEKIEALCDTDADCKAKYPRGDWYGNDEGLRSN